jgi:hypothetical protein
MKSLSLSLLATLVGLAMLVIGIAGVAGAFEEDEDSGSSSSSTTSVDVSDFGSCETSDRRFDEFTTIELTGSGGSANVIVTCQAGSVEVSIIGTGISTDESRTVALWLYNSRSDAELVTSTQQEAGDDTVVLSGALPSGSEDYEKLVVTEGPPSEDFADPETVGRVIMQARL